MAPLEGAPGADGVGGRAQVDHETRHHSASEHVDVQAAQRKRFESLRASLCRAGWELYQTDGGPYFVVRWGKSRTLRTLDDAADFAQQVGAL